MPKKWLQHLLLPLFGAALLGVSGWFLFRELRKIDLHKVLSDISHFSISHILITLAFVAGGYVATLGYDFLGMRYVRAWPGFHRIAFASFVSCAFSNTVSLPIINVSGTRIRFYGQWGLSTSQIMYLVSFIGLSTWMGLLTLTGLMCSLHPPTLPTSSHVPDLVIRAFAALFLAVVAGAIALCATKRKLRLGKWTIVLPTLRLSLGQLAIGVSDWAFQAVVFYMVLNVPHLSLAVFLPTYFAAMLLAMLAHLPAGLGVFDAGIIALLSPAVGKDKLVAGLVLYRLFYHLLPLALATILFGIHELSARLLGTDPPPDKQPSMH